VELSYLQVTENMERETRIELATNSLEGCDSTIELLPHSFPYRKGIDAVGSIRSHFPKVTIYCTSGI
jgi:hypothetical protein